MSVTDLTGTRWLFNTTISYPGIKAYKLDFQYSTDSATAMGTRMRWSLDSTGTSCFYYTTGYAPLVYIITTSRPAGYWVSSDYRNIRITGGDDVANTTLIAWIEANATLVTTPELPTKVGGSWKNSTPYVKIGGYWKAVSNAYVKVGDAWKEI